MASRLTIAGCGAILCLGAWFLWVQAQPTTQTTIKQQPAAPLHAVRIRTPDGVPMITSAQAGPGGAAVKIRCNTCHNLRAPNLSTANAADLKDFHQGLKFDHGKLTCVSCHHAEDYENLRLADGRKLPYPRVMDLCSQCHGPQARDYEHGAHGGMTGYWDLSRGPRERNNCIDCHDPHSPAFPRVQPVFAPKDRFPPRREKETSR